MEGYTNYITQEGLDLSSVFQTINSVIPSKNNILLTGNTFTNDVTFAAISSFSAPFIMNSQLQTLSYGTIGGTTSISAPFKNFYLITATTAFSITIANPIAAYNGTLLIFKRIPSAATNITFYSSAIVGISAIGGGTNVVTTANNIFITCNGSAWWVIKQQ